MSEHTPGPWYAVENSHYWEIRDASGQIGDACASKYIRDGDNGKANAKLMAKAPELLEALKEVLDGLGFLAGGDHELEGIGIDEERGREIRRLIS